MLTAVKSLFFWDQLNWRNKEIEEAIHSETAKLENVGRFWLARKDHLPKQYPKMNAETECPNTNTTISPKRFDEETKGLPEMLAYAGRFQTNDGMTAYLKRNMAKLPENDYRIVKDMLQHPAEDIRREIQEHQNIL